MRPYHFLLGGSWYFSQKLLSQSFFVEKDNLRPVLFILSIAYEFEMRNSWGPGCLHSGQAVLVELGAGLHRHQASAQHRLHLCCLGGLEAGGLLLEGGDAVELL